jgi:hypothetical protein
LTASRFEERSTARIMYPPGRTQITEPGIKVGDLPAGIINQHRIKGLIASEDGSELYVAVGLRAMSRSTA